MGSCASPAIIPTIVVLNPDSVMVPTQASVSSIIGLYDSRRESTQTITEELEAWDDEPEQELEEDGTDGEDSSPESEFEIVAAPALKIRLDTIFETDEMDVEGAFGSLMVRCLSCQTLRSNGPYLDPGVDGIRECQNFSRRGTNFDRNPGKRTSFLLVSICHRIFHRCDLCVLIWSDRPE